MKVQPIKFLGAIVCGFQSPAGDYMEERIDLNEALIQHPAATFFFKAMGDSMTGAYIPPGSRLVVDRLVEPRHGSIIVGVVDGDFTCKRLIVQGTKRMLQPENPKYKPIVLTEETDFKVWGVVTHIIINSKEV
jgi:DNA polymerase V